jgi:hypothetical protein
MSFLDYVLADSRGHSICRAPSKSQALSLLGLVPDADASAGLVSQQASLLKQLKGYMTQRSLSSAQCKELVIYINHPDDIAQAQVLAEQVDVKSKLTMVVAPLKNSQWRIAINAAFSTEVLA